MAIRKNLLKEGRPWEFMEDRKRGKEEFMVKVPETDTPKSTEIGS